MSGEAPPSVNAFTLQAQCSSLSRWIASHPRWIASHPRKLLLHFARITSTPNTRRDMRKFAQQYDGLIAA